MSEGAFGIDVPDGDPGGLEMAAADLRGVSGVMESVAASLAGNSTLVGWTGDASFAYAGQCVSQRGVVESAATTMDAAARVLDETAEELRTATRAARRAVEEAREADSRRETAEADAMDARTRAQSASARGQTLQQSATTAAATGIPSPGLEADASAAFAEAQAASQEAAAAEARAARAREDLEAAKTAGRTAVERYEAYGNRAAGVLASLAGLAPAVVGPGAAAVAGGGYDEQHGDALDGLGKGLGDVKDEALGLLGGVADHVNVFDAETLVETYSNDARVVDAIVDDPGAAAEAVWDATTQPLVDSYRSGGWDEAIARGIPSVAATALGGKGLTKLGKAGAAAEAVEGAIPGSVTPGDTLFRLYGREEDALGTLPVQMADVDGSPTFTGARPDGRSWSTDDPRLMGDPRAELGLPSRPGEAHNPARFLIVARVKDPTGFEYRDALPFHGNPGGRPEVLVDRPAEQLEVIEVVGMNPEP